MQASHGLAVMLFLALIALSLACSDNPSSPAPVLPALDASVEVDPLAQTWGEINLECPETTRPLTGRGAKRGPCCYRGEPNSVRVDAYGDGPESVIEYRANYLVQTNHPDSLSLMALVNTAIERSDHEEQSLLIRFVTARMDGAQASGPGSITLGQGRYNCDGTYSFYANDAAPTGGDFPGADDPSRWAPKVVPITVDASKQGRESATIAFADNYNGRAYTPFVHSGTYEYEWELVTQGFNIRNLGTDREDLDCQGRRNGGMWEPGVDTEAYVVLSDNHHKSNGIPLLQGQTFSQLLAFGPLVQQQDLQELDPLGERCMPERGDPASTCRWVKLPSALCPETEAERALFRCHIGWEQNPYGEESHCTMDPPETPRDDPEGDEGQCCDPLGGQRSGLPACNAFRMETAIVAAAADITDEGGPLTEDCRL